MSSFSAKRKRVLEHENIRRLILSLSLPLFVSGSLQSLYQVVDTFWLSKLGSAALGTPTVSWPYRGILMSIGFGVASSISALTGQYIGAGRYGKASRVVGNVLGLMMIIALPLTLFFFLLRGYYLDIARIPPDVKGLADVYIAVTLIGVIFSYIFLVFNFSLGAAGDTVTPMKISLFSTVLNIVLDPILIFWVGWGVFGAALATLLAMMASSIYALYSFSTGRHGFKLALKDLLPEKTLLSKIASVSTPLVAQRLLTTFGFLFMVGIVSSLGTPVIAAYSIGQVVLSLDHVIVFPIIRSISIIVAQTLGALKYERTRKTVKEGLLLLLTLVSAYVLFLVLLRVPFISVFTKDPIVKNIASRMLLVFGPSVIGFNLLMLANSVARASGHTMFISALGVARLWFFRIPISWLLALKLLMKDMGLWIGMAVSNYVSGIMGVAWLISWRWLKPVIETQSEE